MRIERFTPDDRRAVEAATELANAAGKVDAPFQYPFTVDGYRLQLAHGWDGEVPETYAAREVGRLVGLLAVNTSEWDNRHLVWLEVTVHPDQRGRGVGSALLESGVHRARELGRTSVGLDGWDNPQPRRFAERHDLPRKGSAIRRRQVQARVDRGWVERLHGDAREAANDYELLRIRGRTPDELLPAVAEMTTAINDAPLDDLDIEDEVFPVERIVAYEAAQEARRQRLYRVVARHRESGALAGHTVVAVDSERPTVAEQHDTSVLAAHRGHRLGLLLKTGMLRWLGETEPALGTIDTWNMESNGPMIRVNELLGYEVLGRSLSFQRDV